MHKAYLSISFQNRKNLQEEIAIIQQALEKFSIELFIFVDNYLFSSSEEKQMMQKAFEEIDSSDLLIAEVSEKAIGVGIEIGYAVAKNKPVIYLRKHSTEHSTTASGSADHSIVYHSLADLSEKLKVAIEKMK